MPEDFNRQDLSDLLPQDKMGFAVPKTPAHSIMLLNSYMRTDMLRHIHLRLHKMSEPGSPLHHMAKSLDSVINTYEGVICSSALPATTSTSIQITNSSRSRITFMTSD